MPKTRSVQKHKSAKYPTPLNNYLKINWKAIKGGLIGPLLANIAGSLLPYLLGKGRERGLILSGTS
ncbi:hypothetical protein CHS0354_039211, partial [Potamilus streckersoni]